MAGLLLNDLELKLRAQCQLYMPFGYPDPLQAPADATVRWALRERHSGKVKTAPEIREFFTAYWTNAWGNKDREDLYWTGPKAAVGIGRRLYEFLLKYEVAHPLEPYNLELNSGSISGEYCLLTWKKSREQPVDMILDVSLRKPRDTRVPDYAVLSRWLAARQVSDNVELGIVHQPLVWGERWYTKDVNEVLARKWLNAIVDQAVSNQHFPRIGPQCNSCTHPCKKVFDGPTDYSW